MRRDTACECGWIAAAWVASVSAQTAPPSPVRPYYEFVHWMAMGRTDRAAGQFAADAVVVGGPACPDDAPCVGREAIRTRFLAEMAAGRIALPLVDQRFDGLQLHAGSASAGERQRWVFDLRADRIAALTRDRPGIPTAASARLP